MDSFLNLIRAHAAQLDQGWAQPRIATVSSVDPRTYTARVTIQPENVLTGWLPVMSLWMGNGWGLACLPAPGDQAIVIWQEGDAEQGLILGFLWSQNVIPPSTMLGELCLRHASGSFLTLRNDGTIASSAPTWTHTGDIRATGDVYDSQGPMSRLRAHYDEHTHPPSSQPPIPVD